MRGGGYNHPTNKYWVDMRNLADVAKMIANYEIIIL